MLDVKLQKHAAGSIQRRDPSLKQLAYAYNKLCDEITKLIECRKAPVNAISPTKVAIEGLYSLDVDDDIWQDAGLMESHDDLPPLWLCNEGVRTGIRAILNVIDALRRKPAFNMNVGQCRYGLVTNGGWLPMHLPYVKVSN